MGLAGKMPSSVFDMLNLKMQRPVSWGKGRHWGEKEQNESQRAPVMMVGEKIMSQS